MRVVLGLLLLLFVAVPTQAAYVVSPVGEVGTIPIGTPTTFHVVQAGDDGVPSVHVDVPVRVLLDGEVLYAASPSGGHEYDGVHTVTIAFPRAGRYEVQAMAGEEAVSIASGRVTAHPVAVVPSSLDVQATGPLQAEYDVATDLHTETLLRFVEDGRSVLRTSLHAHAVPQGFTYLPVAAGTASSIHSALQVPVDEPTFAPISRSFPYEGTPAPLVPATPQLPTVQPRNAATVAQGDGIVLVATYDPYTIVGPETMMRIAILALDPDTRLPLPHTDFDARLEGPRGVEFASTSIHEHDGVWEFASRRPVGGYTLHVDATHGDRTASIQATYQVVHALEARSLGPQTVALQVPAEGTTFTATITDALGQPFDHGEILVDLADHSGIPVLSAKVHAHGDGVYMWDMAVPPGEHTLRLEPFALEARPVTFTGDLSHAFSTPEQPAPPPAVDSRDAPTPGAAYLGTGILAAAMLVAFARRR